ncbi:uncharacterized protein BYT42DRAFT_584877 [Radiomyces spectabilis]|uniref:uncharacterized protein n=1 Tax=Radiomyces spectabilis TaxID=64574 RepID=UPI002220782F|nr:uncharacterized protein BYT42DRAFT_584877 [Radiomyces spectabilis]KAI8369559.1 hypothetical protein BYT42DRAFT_584877 [Radiomyces spectabilis]
MNPGRCVDYLAHEWTSKDIIQAHHETRKKVTKAKMKLAMASARETNRIQNLRAEARRLERYQNAVWRQMTRRCISHLGGTNPMVDPSEINWQKEADITWLYGPLYTTSTEADTSAKTMSEHNGGLKSALRQHLNGAVFPVPHGMAGTVTTIGVRFNPEVVQFQYLPESLVHESNSTYTSDDEDANEYEIGTNNRKKSADGNHSEDMYMGMVDYLLSCFRYCAVYVACDVCQRQPLWAQKTSNMVSAQSDWMPRNRRPDTNLNLVTLLIAILKSMISCIMYQSLLPVTWILAHPFKRKQSRLSISPNQA